MLMFAAFDRTAGQSAEIVWTAQPLSLPKTSSGRDDLRSGESWHHPQYAGEGRTAGTAASSPARSVCWRVAAAGQAIEPVGDFLQLFAYRPDFGFPPRRCFPWAIGVTGDVGRWDDLHLAGFF